MDTNGIGSSNFTRYIMTNIVDLDTNTLNEMTKVTCDYVFDPAITLILKDGVVELNTNNSLALEWELCRVHNLYMLYRDVNIFFVEDKNKKLNCCSKTQTIIATLRYIKKIKTTWKYNKDILCKIEKQIINLSKAYYKSVGLDLFDFI